MRVVQGNFRQYQLVNKTKKKDLDGVIYLVAGERNLWVKLLNDKSAAKREQICMLIRNGGSTGFEKPIELLVDEKGKFVGYTFYGREMEIVPERNQEKQNKNSNEIREQSEEINSYSNFASISGKIQLLVLIIIGIIMFVLIKYSLNDRVVSFVYNNISQAAGAGCATLSFDGVLPGIVGIVTLILYYIKLGRNINSTFRYCIMAVLSFASGVVVIYLLVSMISILVIGIFGVVQTYQSMILTAVVLIVLAKILLSEIKK